MLLAVLDLAEAGALAKNEIRYVPNLLERYEAHFDIVGAPTDHALDHQRIRRAATLEGRRTAQAAKVRLL